MSLIEKNTPFYKPVKILTIIKMLSPHEGDNFPIIQHVLVLFVFGSLLTFTTIFHFYKVIKEDIKEINVSEDIFLIVEGTAVVITNLSFLTVRNEWIKLLRHLTDFKKYGERDNFSTTKKWCDYFFKVGLSMLAFYFITYTITIHVEGRKCHKIQEKLKLDLLVCGMYSPIWLPFPVPKYVIAVLYVIQMTLLYVAVTGGAIVFFLYLESVAILKCHVDHLNKLFMRIMLDGNRSRRRSNMKLWVEYHKRIIWITNNFSRLTSRTYSFLIYVSALVVGFCTANSEMTASMKDIVCLFGWAMTTFLLCFAGQVVTNMNHSITDNICNSMWYETDKATKKDILFILMMSQKMNYLLVFPRGAIGLELFVKILQASYSYITLMRNLARSP